MRLKCLVLAVLAAFAIPAVAQQAPPAPTRAPAASAQAGAERAAPDELVVEGKAVGKRVPARPGDICMLCNQPVDEHDAVYLVQGQRVPLHVAEMNEHSASRLSALLAQLRPRGAFIGETPAVGLSPAWFYFGCYVLVGLLFGALCAHRALHTGYNPISWFFAGLAFNLLGYAVLRTRPRREVAAPAGIPHGLRKIAATYSPAACPACGTENHPSATECLGCHAKLTPQLRSEVARAGLRAN